MVILVLGLSACATTPIPKQSSAFSFLNSYAQAKKDFDNGRIMEARSRILAMDATREDYPQALDLLKNKVEPARSRLLRHYSAKARAAEKSALWSDAVKHYEQAVYFSLDRAPLQKKQDEMQMHLRQLRMNELLKQRRAEDETWQRWASAYKPRKGLAADDPVYERALRNYRDASEERADTAYDEARRYLSKDLPEIAYVEAESYLRFVPDSDKGIRLMDDISAAMPSALSIDSGRKKYVKSKSSARTQKEPTVQPSDVQDLIEAEKWQEAREQALLYQRQGGEGAGKLLKAIDEKVQRQAADFFEKGRVAFRQEHINQAVEYWQQAVDLAPENDEYADALNRAQQLQERLRLLRGEDQ